MDDPSNPHYLSIHKRDRKRTDITVTSAELYLLPVQTRVPLKFGPETLTSVTCARVRVHVRDQFGTHASGWGEAPLSVQWAWPAELRVAERHEAMVQFCKILAPSLVDFGVWGHPLEIGHEFIQRALPALRQQFNSARNPGQGIPHLASLVCLSPLDIAIHDAYGQLHKVDIYETYNADWLSGDLSRHLEPEEGSDIDFRGAYPQDFLVQPPARRMPAWHLVGGLDPLDASEDSGPRIDDGVPTILSDWIERDGLFCLKVKLRGNDAEWDHARLLRVGQIALQRNVRHLTADFNCTVTEPNYVNAILDRLAHESGDIFSALLYVEQPFPYELEEHPIDVHSVSARKPLFMDESAHTWQQVRLGRKLGWTGVALKTCKTQTGAILSLCWAKAHGMQLMVQDLTNPMLAQIPHVQLAAHAGTIMGVETNAMQFYPQASALEAAVHPGIYTRVDGYVDLSTLGGPGFGYAGAEQVRKLPPPTATYGSLDQQAE